MAEVGPQIDRLAANIQQRRELAKSSSSPDITTDRSRSSENRDVPRSPTSRLIRASLAATLKDIRSDPQMRLDLLPGFASESKKIARGLDKLDDQFHNNGRIIDVKVGNRKGDIPLPGEHTQRIYAVDLDLNQPNEGQKDSRIPWVMIGGTTSISEQNAALSMALALEGEKVTVLTYPEQVREQEGGRGLLDKLSNIGDENRKAFAEAIKKMGYEKVNLIGHSFGGAVVIEMAADPNLTSKVEVNNVVSLAPSNFERRHVILPKDNIGKAFQDQFGLTLQDPESNVMMAEQGNVDAKRPSGIQVKSGLIGTVNAGLDFMSGGRAAATKRIGSEEVAKAASNIKGEMEVWVGDKDTVCRADATQKTLTEAAEKSEDVKRKVTSYTVEGAVHDTFIANALGLVSAIKQEGEARSGLDVRSRIGMKIRIESLKRAGSEVILERIKQKAVSR